LGGIPRQFHEKIKTRKNTENIERKERIKGKKKGTEKRDRKIGKQGMTVA
jgi:hypothetical protein